MELVTRIKTADGCIHNTTQEAEKHLGVLIGNVLSPICHKMAGLTWSKLPEFVMNNLDEFAHVIRLNDDLKQLPVDGTE